MIYLACVGAGLVLGYAVLVVGIHLSGDDHGLRAKTLWRKK